jgi:hypothetical protein
MLRPPAVRGMLPHWMVRPRQSRARSAATLTTWGRRPGSTPGGPSGVSQKRSFLGETTARPVAGPMAGSCISQNPFLKSSSQNGYDTMSSRREVDGTLAMLGSRRRTNTRRANCAWRPRRCIATCLAAGVRCATGRPEVEVSHMGDASERTRMPEATSSPPHPPAPPRGPGPRRHPPSRHRPSRCPMAHGARVAPIIELYAE